MDEPTTALDVVVQREILQQVEALKRDFGFAVLFITHDLSLLLEFARPDRDHVRGRDRRDRAPAARLGASPQHPYTQGLLESFPPLTGPMTRLTGIPGSPPDLRDPPRGCRFNPRCPHCLAGERGALRAADDRAPAAARDRAGPRGRVPPRRGRSAMTATRSARGSRPHEALRRRQRFRPRSTCTRSTTSRSSCAPARSPRSSARAGAARPPSRACSLVCTTPSAGTSSSTAATSRARGAGATFFATARRCR